MYESKKPPSHLPPLLQTWTHLDCMVAIWASPLPICGLGPEQLLDFFHQVSVLLIQLHEHGIPRNLDCATHKLLDPLFVWGFLCAGRQIWLVRKCQHHGGGGGALLLVNIPAFRLIVFVTIITVGASFDPKGACTLPDIEGLDQAQVGKNIWDEVSLQYSARDVMQQFRTFAAIGGGCFSWVNNHRKGISFLINQQTHIYKHNQGCDPIFFANSVR
jgi:hypothetical protein